MTTPQSFPSSPSPVLPLYTDYGKDFRLPGSPEASSSAEGCSETTEVAMGEEATNFVSGLQLLPASLPSDSVAENPNFSLPSIFDDHPEDLASIFPDQVGQAAGDQAFPSALPPVVTATDLCDFDFDFDELCRALLPSADDGENAAAKSEKDSEEEGDFQPPSTPHPVAAMSVEVVPPPWESTQVPPPPHIPTCTSPGSPPGSPAASESKDDTVWSETQSVVSSQPGSLKKRLRSTSHTGTSVEAKPDRSVGQEQKTREQIEEERLQKRLAKNRRTAAESRERKKAALSTLNKEVESLREENTKLKQALEVQTMHTQLLREELASLTRGAKRDSTAAATNTEPAELNTTVTLPPVHDTRRLQSVPGSSPQNMLNALSIVAMLYLASQTAGTILGAVSSISADPATIKDALQALSSVQQASRIPVPELSDGAPASRCLQHTLLPWQQINNSLLSAR